MSAGHAPVDTVAIVDPNSGSLVPGPVFVSIPQRFSNVTDPLVNLHPVAVVKSDA